MSDAVKTKGGKEKGGWNAGKRPGKPGKVGAMFPVEGSKFMGSKPKGKLPMGGGKMAKGKGK